MTDLIKKLTVEGKYMSSDIVRAGDWAFERLDFTLTMTPVAGGESIQEIGKGMHIYRRQTAGS